MSPKGIPASGRRTRSSRAAVNDELLLDSAAELAGSIGWDAVTVARIASAARLSPTPVTARFGDLTGVGAALWRDRVGPVACARLREVIAAAASPQPERALAKALDPWMSPERDLRIALDLLIAAEFDAGLADATTADVADAMSVPGTVPAVMARAVTAQATYAAALAVGLGLAGIASTAAAGGSTSQAARLAQAIASPAKASRLPSLSPGDLPPLAMSGEERALDGLHEATLALVGLHGFKAATTRAIARTAHVSEGFIFARYATKRALYVDATARRAAFAVTWNESRRAALRHKYGDGRTEAVLLKAILAPGQVWDRPLMLEQRRLAWFDPRLDGDIDQAASAYLARGAEPGESGSSLVDSHGSPSAGTVRLGAAALRRHAPDAWQLPFDIMTVPLAGQSLTDRGRGALH